MLRYHFTIIYKVSASKYAHQRTKSTIGNNRSLVGFWKLNFLGALWKNRSICRKANNAVFLCSTLWYILQKMKFLTWTLFWCFFFLLTLNPNKWLSGGRFGLYEVVITETNLFFQKTCFNKNIYKLSLMVLGSIEN